MWPFIFLEVIGLTVFLNTLPQTKASSCENPPFEGDLKLTKNVKLFWKESNISIAGADDYSVLLSDYLQTPPLITDPDLKDGNYVVVMEDPDAPQPDPENAKSPFQHWLKINSPHNSLDAGDVVLPYMGPSPPKDSPPHRYFVVLYKMPGHKDAKRDVPAGTNKHAKRNAKNALTKLGVDYREPIAWACFKVTSNKTAVVTPTAPPEVTDEMKRLAKVQPGSKEEEDIKKQMEKKAKEKSMTIIEEHTF